MENTQPTNWKTVEPNVWKPEKDGDFIEGKLVSKKEKVGVNESNAYYVESKDETAMVWGSTVLDDRMTIVNVGDMVRITFKGTVKNSRGQDTKIYKVEIGNSQPVEEKVE